MAPVIAHADIDGQWQTGEQHLANGTYTVTMTEHLPNGALAGPAVSVASNVLTITVDIQELGLAAGAGGNTLGLVASGGDDPPGNWIGIDTLDSSVSSGTTLLLYATTADGDLVSRDGQAVGAGVSLHDATLATIGAVHADHGEKLMLGSQDVYLESGLQLHFAVMTGNRLIDTDPDVAIVDQGGGLLQVSVDGFVLGVQTGNDLSLHDMLGETQRTSNDALLYLDHGMTLNLDLAGSCGNTNTLAFVRMDVNATTGERSVDGVAYGFTQDFKDAVLDNLDSGFNYVRGGNFHDTQSWTVAGDSGFYAPVLITQHGDLFVVGDANAGGNEYIRLYGENTFGFEDLTEAQHSDFDYNDMVMHISPASGGVGEGWLV